DISANRFVGIDRSARLFDDADAREPFSRRTSAPDDFEECEVAPVDAEADKNGGGRTELAQKRQRPAANRWQAEHERQSRADIKGRLQRSIHAEREESAADPSHRQLE